jgi:hypothetical protein
VRAVRNILVVACALGALASPGIAHAGSSLYIGAVENAPLNTDLVTAKAKVDLARLAGFDTLRLAVFWAPGRASVMPEWDRVTLENAAAAAQLSGIRLMVSVSNLNGKTTPNTPALQEELAIYALNIARAYPTITDFIIGNEPNLNTFWMPQFAKPKYKTVKTKVRVHGKLVTRTKKVMAGMPADLAAIGYTNLLAKSYDLLKGFNPMINVIGVALSPRGGDNPVAARPTHSPVTFLMDMGTALRKLHRTQPIMDTFAFHPYGESSKIAPTFTHPNSKSIGLGDYTKLTTTLKNAFTGTAQPAAALPIVYDEFGVQTTIPSAKTGPYTNLGTAVAKDAVSEALQAQYYRQAITMAYCQPNVVGLLFFHVTDEFNANTWQSGLYYADDTPKTSLAAVRATAESARDATLSSCASAAGTRSLQTLTTPDKETFTTDDDSWSAKLTCVRFCSYDARIQNLSTAAGPAAGVATGDVQPGVEATITFPQRKLEPGTYRIAVRVWQYGRVGTTVLRYGKPFTVEAPPPPPPPPLLPPLPPLPPPPPPPPGG